MTQITDHLADIRARVAAALERANRDSGDAMILAVGKKQPASAIRAACAAGQRHFAENYLQEALGKMDELTDLEIEWHFVGKIQSNKTRPIAERFGWVHTVDRAKLVPRLAAQRPHYAPPLNVFVQVNQGSEPRKAGVRPDEARALAELIAAQPRLRLRGLMSIPPAGAAPEESAAFFADLRELGNRLRARGIRIDMLSMGMSADFELAIAEGSNCVRIGTGIFGSRAR